LAWLPEDDFVNYFAADVEPVKAKVMHAAVEVPSSHVAMVSHPDDVANLIETAAKAVPVTT
jgi:hypothetical protein